MIRNITLCILIVALSYGAVFGLILLPGGEPLR